MKLAELQEAVSPKLMDQFIANAKSFWTGSMSEDQERILRQNRKGVGGGNELLDILSGRVKKGFNGEKMKTQFEKKKGTPFVPFEEVIKRLSKKSSWNQFLGARGFKGFI